MARETRPREVQVNVKFAPGADPQRSVPTLKHAPGVRKVIQTFPGETDPDLASLYVLEIDASDLDPALEEIRQNPDVEYVEQTAPRKLIW